MPRSTCVDSSTRRASRSSAGSNAPSTRVQTRRRYNALYEADNWYLVSLAGGSIGTIPISTDVANLPSFDLAVITAPPGVCLDLVEQCGERGARFAIVVSSGFNEVGSDGALLEQRLVEAGRRSGVRILGPNTNTNAFERQPDIAKYRFGRSAS